MVNKTWTALVLDPYEKRMVYETSLPLIWVRGKGGAKIRISTVGKDIDVNRDTNHCQKNS